MKTEEEFYRSAYIGLSLQLPELAATPEWQAARDEMMEELSADGATVTIVPSQRVAVDDEPGDEPVKAE